MIKGNAWNYGDNVNTDYIIPGKYLELTDPNEMAKHAMEGIDPEFSKRVTQGDIIIGGKNFGLGSSREHAPLALVHSGVGAVIAEGYARIFYRNAINLGLPVLECENVSEIIKTGDKIEIDLEKATIWINKERKLKIQSIPEFMKKILESGGLREYIKRHKEEW
jgi:3-isopropylmalate/(R)-2-methylmalate dehydratase small subunit